MGRLLQNRHTVLFDRTRIDGGFVGDDIASIQHRADDLRSTEDSTEIGHSDIVDRGRRRNDVEIGRRQRGGIALINQRSLREFRRLDFPGYIDAGAQVSDPLAIDIESDHRAPERANATATGSPT
jgi:hypothetical protein